MEEPKLTLQSFHQCASLISIRLGSNNYLMWRSQILHLARSLGVLHHLEKNDDKPERLLKDGVVNPAYTLWLTNDGLLISWLLGTIKEEAQPSIAEDATAYDVWSSLEEQLLPITIEKEGLLKNMLMTIKKGSRSLDDYTKEFKSICDNLAAIKKPVDDLDKVFQFARGLGAKYENFRLAMTIASQKEEEKNYIEYNQALFSQRGRGRGCRGSFNSKGRGFTPAGRYNNAGSNNFKRDGTNGIVQQSKGDKPTCQICGKLNHIALYCWYRFDYSYQSEDLPQALAALTLNNNDPSFYMDSGATAHMTNNAGMLSYTKPYKGNDVIYVGNGNKLDITHSGNACVGELNLKDVLVVPKLKKNLISDHNKRTIGKGHRQGQLYALEPGFQEALSAIKGDNSFSLWHQRLGHPSAKILSLLKGKKVIDVTNWQTKSSICVSCQSGKSCKLPFNLNNDMSNFPLQKVHCDLWGPASTVSNQGFRF
nr:Retrovirus-related Pol polyprotein from transposon RE1 [Ipomoea batatas]